MGGDWTGLIQDWGSEDGNGRREGRGLDSWSVGQKGTNFVFLDATERIIIIHCKIGFQSFRDIRLMDEIFKNIIYKKKKIYVIIT